MNDIALGLVLTFVSMAALLALWGKFVGWDTQGD